MSIRSVPRYYIRDSETNELWCLSAAGVKD